MKKAKYISFILILILLINIALPIISEANNIIKNEVNETEAVNNTKTVENEIIENNNISNTISENNVIENIGKENTVYENKIENNISDSNSIKEEAEEVENSNKSKEHETTNIPVETKKDNTGVNAENEISTQNEEDKISMQNEENGIALFSEKTAELGVKYSSHVQDYGWETKWKQNGERSGTTGQNKKIEAMKIELTNNSNKLHIKYQTYAQGIGWQNIISDGKEAGTTGRNLRMEAIKIWLEGTEEYSVMYRTHIQDFGWQDWSYDGDISGNLGDNKKIEAIEIKIVSKKSKDFSITYTTHVQDYGWQKESQEYDISGTTGQNKKVEALKINLKNAPSGVYVRYKAYVENNGWQSWKTANAEAGSTGKNLKLLGLRIELQGTTEYSVYYRTHIQDRGWTDWKKNSAVAGDISLEKKIEAIQVKIVKEKNTVSTEFGVEYYTCLQGSSSNENKIESNGEISGTVGENRKVEALQVELKNAPSTSAHIKYKAHVENYGWMDWVKDGQIAGVMNKGLKIEAIKVELEGLDNYTVEYKAHVQDYGWTDWYIDGETAGTTGKNKKIEAIQIRIVPKYKRYFKGIDVSYWQGQIDFDKLKASGQVDFMITRIGWYRESKKELNVDTQFERNYKEAKRKNIPLGAYFYSYATSIDEVKREANSVVDYLKRTRQTDFELPIFFDIEDGSQISLGKDIITQMSIEFCEILKKAGFNKVGVYSYSYWLENYMYISKLPKDYSIWVANYGKNDSGELPDNIFKYADTYDIWQYSSSGRVNGINGNVDMNICYKKYF